MDVNKFRARLETDYSISIAGGQGKLEGTMVRIGHVGHLTDKDIAYFSESFRKALKSELSQ